MWLLFHHNAKTRTVRDGKSFVDTCPECKQRVRFSEVEISENLGVFFVDLVGDKQRKFKCGGCGDLFDLRDQEEQQPPRAALPTKSIAELEAELEQARQDRKQLAEAKSVRIEDELAALKKRLGR